MSEHQSRPPTLVALSAFFGFGTVVSSVTAVALLLPGRWSEAMWRLNPAARVGFEAMGPWGVVLMVVVALACGAAGVGLWCGRRWGYRLAVGVLGVNLLGDVANALVRGDRRTLIGLPIGGAMLAYLLTRRIRRRFAAAG